MRKNSVLLEPRGRRRLLDGRRKVARNWKRRRNKGSNQKEQQEQSHRGQKAQGLFRKVQFAESSGCL